MSLAALTRFQLQRVSASTMRSRSPSRCAAPSPSLPPAPGDSRDSPARASLAPLAPLAPLARCEAGASAARVDARGREAGARPREESRCELEGSSLWVRALGSG